MLIKSYIYYRFGTALLLCFCFVLSSSAQQFTVKGVVFKKNTPITIAYTSITNLTSKTPEVLSDEVGGFHIQAAIGDSLLFKKADYTTQVIVILKYSDQSVYMQPIVHLDQVTIKDISKRQQLNDVMDDYRKKGQYTTLNPSVASVLSSPLTGIYELFGKGPGQARKFQKYTKEEMERLEVAKRYNKPLVKQITKMPDEDLEDFMINFTPNVEDIRIWSDYDIIKYIEKSYTYFKANKGNLKLQKLN
jgi:hypothetical protein